MKKILSVMLSAALLCAYPMFTVTADDVEKEYLSDLSAMVSKYDDKVGYFESISVKVGDSDIDVDGKKVSIDENGTTAYVEDGRTMMPVRGIAEAVGAKVTYNANKKTVTVENEEKEVNLEIGSNKMKVNDATVEIVKAPEIKNNRTMLPVRDMAEAIDCEVTWDGERQTAIFTKPYQTKRVIAFLENADTEGAVASFTGNGMTIMQFKTIEDAKLSVERNNKKGITAEPDHICSIDSLSWGTSDIGAEEYSAKTQNNGEKALVAVVDSGVDYGHAAVSGRITGGYDLCNNDNYCEDQNGHGTHVASIISDVAGANGKINIMPIKVFGSLNTTTDSFVAAGIEYAVSHDADVINLSLGGIFTSEAEKRAINKARAKDIAVIAAAGNEKTDISKTAYSPAGLDGVISVSAIDRTGNFADFSNYGKVDFAAPGVDINGAKVGGGYIVMSGTSMAAPHVAGAYALARSGNPDKTADEITSMLKRNTTRNTGNSQYYGAGIINLSNFKVEASSWSEKDMSAKDITQDDARISITLNYSGSSPTRLRLFFGSDDIAVHEVYSWDVTGNNGTLGVSCDLKNDSGTALSPNTRYFYYFSVTQDGAATITEKNYFRTLKAEEADNGSGSLVTPIPTATTKPTVTKTPGYSDIDFGDIVFIIPTATPIPTPIPTVAPTPVPVPAENTQSATVVVPDQFGALNIRTGPSTSGICRRVQDARFTRTERRTDGITLNITE